MGSRRAVQKSSSQRTVVDDDNDTDATHVRYIEGDCYEVRRASGEEHAADEQYLKMFTIDSYIRHLKRNPK